VGGVIHVEISELVLNGFPSTDRFSIAESVAHELADLFARGHAASQPRSVGEQIARDIFEAVRRA
jgi:hypothetical protein